MGRFDSLNMENTLLEAPQSNGSDGLIFEFLSRLNQISFGIYTNLFAFILVMLLLDLFFKIIKDRGARNLLKEIKSPRRSSLKEANDSRTEGKLLSLISENTITRILCYLLIFMSIQIFGLGLSFLAQSELLNTAHNNVPAFLSEGAEKYSDTQVLMNNGSFNLPRMLEEVNGSENIPNPPSVMLPDKISLAMGNIMGSLSLAVKAMILSKDKKIAFVTIEYYGTLHIIDLSEIQSPFILSSMDFDFEIYGSKSKNLILSSDEKTLYVSNSASLEIIDITDLNAPKLISTTKSEIFSFEDDHQMFPRDLKTSLALSESAKTLYIGGLELQVYDISDPKKPVLVKTFKSKALPLLGNEVCLSRDEKILFVANGTLDVYNISNPRKIKLLRSLKTESSPRSLLVSEDFKTLFLLGTSVKQTQPIVLEEMDISNYNSLKVQKSAYIQGARTPYTLRFLAISPSRSKLFIVVDSVVLVFDRIKQTFLKNEENLIVETFALEFSVDGKTLITASNQHFLTIELFLDYPNHQIFGEQQNNLINTLWIDTISTMMEISPDGTLLFIVRSEDDQPDSPDNIFEIWSLKNKSEPTLLADYMSDKSISKMYFSKNYETVYLLHNTQILVLNITNRSSIELIKTYAALSNERFGCFIASSDEKTGFLLMRKGEIEFVTFVDLSKPSGTIESSLKLEMKSRPYYRSRLILKDDDKTLLVLNKEMTIYNISNLSSPLEIVSMPYKSVNEQNFDLSSHQLSLDNKTLFIETSDKNNFNKLRIYDLSVLASPQLISEKYFPKGNKHQTKEAGFSLSPDPKSGFFLQEDYLILLNLENLKDIRISGIIPLSNYEIEKNEKRLSDELTPFEYFDSPCYLISPDRKTIYASFGNKIRILNMNPQYTLFMKQEKFLLGEKYSNNIVILNLTEGFSDYTLVGSNSYKFISLTLGENKIDPNKASLGWAGRSLPSWMTFDKKRDIFTVEPRKQSDIGTYPLYSVFSLKIPRGVFKKLGTTKNPISTDDLWAWLISLGYVDPQLYLTESFGRIDDFILPSNFTLYKEEIWETLRQYKVTTCTLFEVVSSLELNNQSLPTVSSLSTSPIKVEIKLEPKIGVDVKFVNRPYGSLIPVMKENKTKVSFEGTVKEINTALDSIVVNFENGTSCDANIIIIDDLNPPISTKLKNISSFVQQNKPPIIKNKTDKTVQEQIDDADIQTGKHFTFTLSEDIFEDEYIDDLKYEVVTAKNKTAFPTWLNANGLTLKGTPPEEISGRDLDLVLIAKNEFKENRIPFKLHISISAVFWLKLAMKYSPYILTIVGLIVKANKILNILGKRFYKHSREFYFNTGEEISVDIIFPISFIKEERRQSDLILKQLKQSRGHIAVRDFIDEDRGVIKKERVVSAIKETIHNMPLKAKNKLTLYPSRIIDQIIINKFVWKQLDSANEIKTRSVFEKLKPHCLEVVQRDSSGFIINQNKLNKLLKEIQGPPEERTESLSMTVEESLISHDFLAPGVNIDLLKDAILAFAFESHSLDISPTNVDIGVKQKVPANFLWRFLKRDLKDKGKMNYGIKYQIIDDALCFYGKVCNYFKGKTLVVQIKNRKQRIFKEIWIHGISERIQKVELVRIKDEPEARGGASYEVL